LAVSASYIGRFAPSPTGPLHAGSLVAALGSWLDARAQGGRWAVRMEDIDAPRCVPGADATILAQLAACGLHGDLPVVWQSRRSALYDAALERLRAAGWSYPCACTRKDIDEALRAQGLERRRHAERVYPGTCRAGLGGRVARAVRVRASREPEGDRTLEIGWFDRRLGPGTQDVTHEVGDFVVSRADGLAAYQLAVVVDDAAQGITDVVRGEDLADNTPRQIHLQRLLGLPSPRYLHLPLVLGPDGEKLSKQNGAPAIDAADPVGALRAAGRVLGVASDASDVATWLGEAVAQWRARWRQPA
jgi:glutamyl-Q tRNA(Asp) synthetase